MTEAPTTAPKLLTESQRAFAQARLTYLERLLNLFKLGKPGIAQVKKEIEAEASNFRRQLVADDITKINEDAKQTGHVLNVYPKLK